LPSLLVNLVVFLSLLFGQNRAYLGSRLFLQFCNLPVVGFQQFPIFHKQLIKIGPGSFNDTLKLLTLLGSEFELVVIDLVYFPRGPSGLSVCPPSRFVDIVDYCSNHQANREYRQDEQLCSRRTGNHGVKSNRSNSAAEGSVGSTNKVYSTLESAPKKTQNWSLIPLASRTLTISSTFVSLKNQK